MNKHDGREEEELDKTSLRNKIKFQTNRISELEFVNQRSTDANRQLELENL